MCLVSYVTVGKASYEDTLDRYASMPLGGFATGQLGVGQLLSYPILAHAAVTEVAKMILVRLPAGGGAPSEKSVLLVAAPAKESAADGGFCGFQGMCFAEALAGIGWVLATTALAIALPDVSSLLALVGAASAAPLMVIFPPAMLLRHAGRAERLWPLHAAMLALGCVATFACCIMAVLDFGQSSED